uniref:hypothetical protein n=1 Tax=Microbulbifer pacificus TaxID=407164 RepID=UPI000CF5086F
MNKRDLQIIKDVERFRVLSRDDIIDLYFSNLKNPVTSANIVLKRLVRDRQISVSKYYSPFVYLPIHSTVKQNSTKIPHFLQIVEVYKILKHALAIKQFIVEPKFQKGLAEPDMLVMLNNVSLFIEIQRNTYSQKVMNKKIKRYEELSSSEQFRNKKFP